MLSNAYFLAKFRFDTAENEPVKNSQNCCKIVAKLLQNFAKFANFANPSPLTLRGPDDGGDLRPAGPPGGARRRARGGGRLERPG